MKIQSNQSAWFKKYMPQTLEDMILPEGIKKKLIQDLKDDKLTHLGLFSQNPGTGKSSLAESILRDNGVLEGESMSINASLDSGKDTLRQKLEGFAIQASYSGRKKIILMDEFDSFSKQGQDAFRGFIDEFSENCIFIFTGNHKEKIIQPLLDRMQVFDFQAFDKKDMIPQIFERLKFILDSENVKYAENDLVPVINTFYPSIRGMVGALQRFSIDGELKIQEGELDNIDKFSEVLELVLQKNFQGVLDKVKEVNAPDSFYTLLFGKIHLFGTKQPQVIMSIAKYQHMSTSVRDKQVNLCACLTEIIMILSQK